MPNIEIDPTRITPEDSRVLFTFFKNHPNDNFWKDAIPYNISSNPESSEEDTLTFTHQILKRNRLNRANTAGVRFECIIPKSIAKGGTARIYDSSGTLELDEEAETLLFKNTKNRVVKRKKMEAGQTQINSDLLNRLLHMKMPITVKLCWVFIVMRKQPGRELFDIINDESKRESPVPLTVKRRIELTLALLKALKTQVVDIGLIHRDIKPDNIMVDMSTDDILVNIIDYDFSRPREERPTDACCTLTFAAPEQLYAEEQTDKCDVFSMGRVLQILWGDDTRSFHERDLNQIFYNAQHVTLNQLFRYLPLQHNKVNQHNRNLISRTLTQMLRANPLERISIDEAIGVLSDLDLNNEPDSRLITSPISRRSERLASDGELDLGLSSDEESVSLSVTTGV